ncbi:MAG: hypothetical protein RLZZ163_672 [Actinomycetota bacterium]
MVDRGRERPDGFLEVPERTGRFVEREPDRAGVRVDREPLAERARDVRGEADVRDAMIGRLPGKSPKTQQSHAQHAPHDPTSSVAATRRVAGTVPDAASGGVRPRRPPGRSSGDAGGSR